MPLRGKYLKYSPEITLEIFTLIYDKLIENEWTSINVMSLYNQFTGNWNYIVDHGRGKQFYSSVTNRELTETTVQEILGYDPFVKNEIIPEYVECIETATCNTKVGEIFKCRQIGNSFEWEYNNKTIKDYSSWDGWSVPWSDKLPQKHFKPSTKEAFDAQNKLIEDTIECEECNGTGEVMIAKLYPNGHTEVNEECPICGGEGIIDKPKQSLKQAVHCTTQEEWDFVTKKLGYKWSEYSEWSAYKNNTCINLKELGFGTAGVAYKGYQILSFQEWCDLNGYKMEKEVKFEVGDWVIVLESDSFYDNSEKCPRKIHSINDKSSLKYSLFFRDGHTNSYNKIRHATPEEINNHLISIGQIPAGEPLNIGIEPNKDGAFKYTTYSGTTHVGKTSIISGPLKVTLSIDDEELPMVSIIKTNTIKQLLNND